jgi:hypothetical protein
MPSNAVNFVPAEDAALCKAYVNVTLNPIDGVGQKASAFWDHIHRKCCLLLKQDNPSEALPDRDSESLKNRFQRQIQKKMNVYNRYYKLVKECPPSGTTEEEWYKIAGDNYRDAEGHAFAFIHSVEVLHQLPMFNPMIDDADRSSDVFAEDSDGDKKPAASVNKIGAPMGASLKRPPGSKKAKKELLFRDSSLSGSTAASVAMKMMAESHSALVTAQNRLVSEDANQTRVQSIKEQMAGEQMKCTIYQRMGNDDAVLCCLAQIEILQAELAAMRTEPQPRAIGAQDTEDECPVEEVDLTGEEQEVDLTHAEVDDSSEADDDSEAVQDVEEMYAGAEV